MHNSFLTFVPVHVVCIAKIYQINQLKPSLKVLLGLRPWHHFVVKVFCCQWSSLTSWDRWDLRIGINFDLSYPQPDTSWLISPIVLTHQPFVSVCVQLPPLISELKQLVKLLLLYDLLFLFKSVLKYSCITTLLSTRALLANLLVTDKIHSKWLLICARLHSLALGTPVQWSSLHSQNSTQKTHPTTSAFQLARVSTKPTYHYIILAFKWLTLYLFR